MTKKTSRQPAHNQARRRGIVEITCETIQQGSARSGQTWGQSELTTFKVSLKSKESVVALAKSHLESMMELLLKSQKYMNIKDALAEIRVRDMWKARRNVQEDSKGKKRERKDYSSSHDNVKLRNDKTIMMVNFTPIVMHVVKILMQIKDDHPLKWPKPLNCSPSSCNKKYCRFHQDHEHYMNECRDLKEQIEELI